jgi:hypothetical protein
MRQYLRVAVIEVSKESLRLLVGDEVLGQAAWVRTGTDEEAPDLRGPLTRAQAALTEAES